MQTFLFLFENLPIADYLCIQYDHEIMKKTTLVFVFIFIGMLAHAQVSTVNVVEVGGVARTYRLYVPAIYDGSESVPVIFNFHGYGSSAIEQEIYANFKPIADTANFLIVLPQGLTDGNGNTFWHDFSTISSLQIDLDFFDTMLDSIGSQYNIDVNRVYSTGMSNGGFFSYDLACHRSNKIAAVASVSGSMVESHVVACNAQHPMPILQFHGTADNVVFYEGNGGLVSALGAEDLVAQWVGYNECNDEPEIISVPDIDTLDNSTVEHYIYHGGNEGATVEFFKITGGGHSWPGSFPLVTLGTTNQDINACLEIWRFFSQYQLDELVSIPEIEIDQSNIQVYPNPAGNSLLIESGNGKFELFEASGKLVNTYEIRNKHEEINVSNLPQGMYFYRFKKLRDQSFQSGKVIIEK